MTGNSILAKMVVQITANNAAFGAAMKQSQAQMRGFQKTAQTLNTALGAVGLGLGLTEAIRVFQASVGIMADFERSMSEVRAITGATGKEFKSLEADAMRLGRTTKFTATEVSQLQVAFGRLGFSTKEILDATEATLDLAAATGEDLAKSADVAGSTVRGFGLDANQTLRVADVMAVGFNKTALSLDNFTESMKYVAPVAHAAGASVEETTALLGVLANAGIRGSQAGTSLRRIFTDMTKDGRPLQVRLQELADKGLNLSDSFDEIGRIAQTSLLVLSKGTDQFAELTKEADNAAGSVHEMARIMQDNLTGDTTKLKSAVEGLVLKFGEGNTTLREFVQGLTKLVAILSDDQTIKVIKAWFDVVTFIPRKTIEGINAIIDAIHGEADAFKEMADRRRKEWEERESKRLSDEKQKIEAVNDARKRYNALLRDAYKAIPYKNPNKEESPSDAGDEFYHPNINKDPLSGIDLGEPVPGVVKEIEYNKELHDSLLTLEADREKQIQQMQTMADTAVNMGTAIGDAFEGMIEGTTSFAGALAKVTEEIITMYLRQSIAAMIAASIKDPSTPFPFAKIAIAAAGIGVIKGLFSRIGGDGGGGIGGGIAAPGRTPSEIKVSGRSYVRGYTIETVLDKDSYRRGRVG